MPSLCFYFQVHQPCRIRKFSYFENSSDLFYFDEIKNRAIAQKVAAKCYLPANNLMLELINRFNGRFKIAYSITGIAIEQMWRYCPEVIDSFKALAATGCVEFLAETYYHSLSSLYDENEFRSQVNQQVELIKTLFGQTPQIFRNTELIYDDRIGRMVNSMGFKGMLAEGVDSILDGRSANEVYTCPGTGLRLLLKDYRHSDDIAFRFSNTEWEHYPLTPDKFAYWMHRMTEGSQVVNLFMDYETFGEHQWDTTGIFDFMRELPGVLLADPRWDICAPSEIINRYEPQGDVSFYRTTSWADVRRDLSAWQGNRMQNKALDHVYKLSAKVRASNDPYIIETWKKLQTSDHFYYMSNKSSADGAVHAYFSPYESPYDAFVYYMNVLRSFSQEVARAAASPRPVSEAGLIVEKIRISAANNIAPDDIPSMDQTDILEATAQ